MKQNSAQQQDQELTSTVSMSLQDSFSQKPEAPALKDQVKIGLGNSDKYSHGKLWLCKEGLQFLTYSLQDILNSKKWDSTATIRILIIYLLFNVGQGLSQELLQKKKGEKGNEL